MNETLSIFVPISKVDEKKRLVYGTITQETPDKSGEIFDYATGKKAIQTWSDGISEATSGKSKGNVRAMHGNTAAGKFTDIAFDDKNRRIEGVAKVVDDDEWQKVLEGVYTGFSIGGGYARRWADKDNPALMRYTPTISEVSLVDNPCVPSATFEFIKADGTRQLCKFKTHKDNTMNDKSDKPEDNLATNAINLLATSISDLSKAITPAKDKDDDADDEDKDDDADEVKAEKKKRREEKAKKKAAADKDDAAMAAKAAGDKAKDGKSGDVDYADEKNKKYPIDTEEHIRAAWNYIHKKKNAGEYKESEVNAIKAKIVAAWKKKIDKDGPPEADNEKAMKSLNADVLAKGMHGVSHFACIIAQIDDLATGAEIEASIENDNSDIPEKLKAWLKDGTALLKEMTEEETAELFDSEDGDTDVEVDKFAGIPADNANALAKFLRETVIPAKLEKSAEYSKLINLVNALEKAGAKFSGKTKEDLMELHKSAAGHLEKMEKCFKGMGIMPEQEEEPATKILKFLEGEKQELKNQNNELIKALFKTSEDVKALAKDFNDKISQQQNEIQFLKNQPMPGKGVVRAVSKSDDGGTSAKAIDYLNALPPEERNRELMKLALGNPISVK